jgi:HK97 family phage major capsid protein
MLEEIKSALDERDTVIAKKLAAVEEDNAELRERLEQWEAKASSPGKTANGETHEMHEHKKLFNAWLRRPRDSETNRKLTEFERHAKKSLSVSTPSDGGYAVPEILLRDLDRLEKKFSPVRDLVRVVQVSSGDVRGILNIRGTDAGWVGESGPRPETDTSKLREIVPTFGELYAYPKVSEWAMDDMAFDVGAWVVEEVAQQFAIEEGDAVSRGNGSNKLTGMLNTAPTSRDDFDSPLRAAAAYQFVTDGDSPYAIDADTLISLFYKVNSSYRSNGTWVFDSATASVIRKLKDTNSGNYLWTPGLGAAPDTLLGRPISVWEQMDDVDVTGGSNATYPVAFGDFRRGYLICDRTGVRVTVDSNITSPGYVKFFVRRREAGIVWNNDAIKWIKTAA